MHMRSLMGPLGLFFATFLFCVGLVAVPAGCTKNSAANTTLQTAQVAVDAAAIGFTAWDAAQRKAIVDHATSREDALAKLAEYDTKIAGVEQLILAARELLKSTTKADETTVKATVKAATDLLEAITKLRGGT